MLRLAPMLFMLVCAASSLALGQESVQVLDGTPGTEGGSSITAVSAPPPPCGTQPITIARMPWPSAALLAEIHSRLLADHFACSVSVQEGDLASTGTTMGATGQPAVAPELWVARIADTWNAAMNGQKVRQAGTSYADPLFEGWYVPDYTVAQWPEVTTVEGLKAHAGDFAAGGQRGRFISCPLDWGCALINRNMLRGLGLDGAFEIVEPANRFEMDTLIAEAVGRKQPIVFYYWQPNAILSQFAFRPVDLGAYDHDAFQCMGKGTCPLPRPTGFAPDPVVIGLADWVYLDAPRVAAYFGRARMPMAEMNLMLQQLGEAGASIETVADRFVTEREEVWRGWVGQVAQ